jgi:hypothetical protein
MKNSIKKYEDWLNESEENSLEEAEKLSQEPELKDLLVEVEEGKHSNIRIQRTTTAKSYVGVSINPDDIFSEMYITDNPKAVLVAIIMKTSKRHKATDIRDIIMDPTGGFLRYDVFAGENKLSPREIANKYNFSYRSTDGDAVPFYTSSPTNIPM